MGKKRFLFQNSAQVLSKASADDSDRCNVKPWWTPASRQPVEVMSTSCHHPISQQHLKMLELKALKKPLLGQWLMS